MRGKDLLAVILAAGRGRRLEPVSLDHSKAMTPILGVPIIVRVIESLGEIGFKDFVVVVSPEDKDIVERVKKLGAKGFEFRFASQPKPLGTADALLCARDKIERDFLLIGCDNLFSRESLIRIKETYIRKDLSAVLTLSHIRSPEDLNSSAGVKLKGNKVVEIREKPGPGSGSWDAICKFLFVLSKGVLEHLDRAKRTERGEYEFQSIVSYLLEGEGENEVEGVFVDKYLHLTSVKDLILIHEHYLKEHLPFSVHPDAEVDSSVKLKMPVMIERKARIEPGSCIGPFVYIGEGARIKRGATISRSVIYSGEEVEEGARLEYVVRSRGYK